MMSIVAEQFVDANGARLWTARHGAGPSLLLLHGGPGLWDSFDELGAMVDDLVEVHRFDQRGGGRSSRTPPYTVETLVADIEALRLHWGHARWIVGGHSAGANLALAYAAAHPARVLAVLYLSGTGLIDDWRAEYDADRASRLTPEQRARLAELRALIAKTPEHIAEAEEREYTILSWSTDFADRSSAPARAEALLRPGGPSFDVNRTLNDDWRRILADGALAGRVAALDIPVLILHGAADPRPVRVAERLARSLPRARPAVIPEAGHWPWLENPGPAQAAIRSFLTSIGSGS